VDAGSFAQAVKPLERSVDGGDGNGDGSGSHSADERGPDDTADDLQIDQKNGTSLWLICFLLCELLQNPYHLTNIFNYPNDI
jgi:hypothetical protein